MPAEALARAQRNEAEIRRLSTQLARERTRRMALQDRLDQAVKLEALGEMTTGIAHDLNNLIAGTAAAFQLIARRTTDEKVLVVADLGARTALRGEAMVKRLLAFARKQASEPADLAMPAFLADADDIIRQAVGDAVQLTIACPEGTWPIRADPMQLEAALVNLVSNARDALGTDGRIAIEAVNAPAQAPGHPVELAGVDAVAITVSDTGQGMSPDVLQRVTEPFFTTKPAGKGTGLGLAMVHGFARQCGGAVRMESRLGEGTTIVIFIPRANPAATPDAEPGAAPDAATPPANALTILLVDGHQGSGDQASGPLFPARDHGATTAETLRGLGYIVQETTDAVAAMLAAIRNETQIDIVLSKVPMPGDSDNAALVDAIRHERPHLPILFVSVTGGPAISGEDIIAEPFTGPEIAARIEALLLRCETRRQDSAQLDRLASRIRSPRLKRLLQHWRDVMPSAQLPSATATRLPALHDFGAMPDGIACDLALFSVDLACVPMRFSRDTIGSELARAASLSSNGTSLAVTGDEMPGAREAAYRRCVNSARPCYEHARFSFSEIDVTTFERLILPFAEDGATVSRILCVVTLDANPAEPEPTGGPA